MKISVQTNFIFMGELNSEKSGESELKSVMTF
jgi:hypothetical protein